ncbi:Exopolysaccharide synthesis, ExoD [Legionella massiliensis]|uniref:Exopolysaccharide synthesis, ExoD n=1 Tax=Legionella massiliensis TaxID=1034943 RepID=A0A078KWL8_9GAMM|nr:exopolysaccharide biosynthesis protein [Legionella massiliensis]CDZ76144.1 Exopolysaccharide synthesis, ExoD [Legionella massiliensis]CEE11882.1 Exopolysaccharide synthesis, ExoD [Legionella massiliensis]
MKERVNNGSSVSGMLKKLVKTHQNESSVSYEELVKTMGEKAYGLIAILFALPSALPVSAIPGISFIFGLPIVFIAVHIILARPALWLPQTLAKRRIAMDKLSQVIKKTLPYLLYIERMLKTRWLFFSSPTMERLHGIVLLGLSLLLLLPIPFSNFFFSSLIILFGLGISERDGIVLALAYLGSFLYALFLISLARGLTHLIFS